MQDQTEGGCRQGEVFPELNVRIVAGEPVPGDEHNEEGDLPQEDSHERHAGIPGDDGQHALADMVTLPLPYSARPRR